MRRVEWICRREQQILLLISFDNVVYDTRIIRHKSDFQFLVFRPCHFMRKLWMKTLNVSHTNKGKLGRLISKWWWFFETWLKYRNTMWSDLRFYMLFKNENLHAQNICLNYFICYFSRRILLRCYATQLFFQKEFFRRWITKIFHVTKCSNS